MSNSDLENKILFKNDNKKLEENNNVAIDINNDETDSDNELNSINDADDNVNDDINDNTDDDTDETEDDISDDDEIEDDKTLKNKIDDDDDDFDDGNDDDDDDDAANNAKKNSKITINMPTAKFIESEDDEFDEDDNEDDNEDEYYKFDEETRETFLEEHHPEAKIHNYEEILLLSKVERNKDGIIIDDFHQTLPFLTKYEKTRILGQRAKQLDDGANAFISVPENIIDGYQIAEMELEEKKIPFIIRRPLPNGNSEYWKIEDLEIF
jgi:DNA-directed RNA polymerase I, II, and III subunit RPABC2